MTFAPECVNHTLPSGPAATAQQFVPIEAGNGNSVTPPAVVMRPMVSVLYSANHSEPSGPGSMIPGNAAAVGTANSVTVPDRVTRAILSASPSATQIFPSGPAVMRSSPLPDGI